MTKGTVQLLSILLAPAWIAGACGGDSSNSTTTAAPATTAPLATTEAPEPLPVRLPVPPLSEAIASIVGENTETSSSTPPSTSVASATEKELLKAKAELEEVFDSEIAKLEADLETLTYGTPEYLMVFNQRNNLLRRRRMAAMVFDNEILADREKEALARQQSQAGQAKQEVLPPIEAMFSIHSYRSHFLHNVDAVQHQFPDVDFGWHNAALNQFARTGNIEDVFEGIAQHRANYEDPDWVQWNLDSISVDDRLSAMRILNDYETQLRLLLWEYEQAATE